MTPLRPRADRRPPGSDAQRQTLGSDAKSAGLVSLIDELQGVDRRVPFILRLLQGKRQPPGAAYAAPHQDQPAKPNGYPDEHLNRRDGRQTEHQTDEQRYAAEGEGASCYDEPAAAPCNRDWLFRVQRPFPEEVECGAVECRVRSPPSRSD